MHASVRELKARLSQQLRQVEAGATITVQAHNRQVAEIVLIRKKRSLSACRLRAPKPRRAYRRAKTSCTCLPTKRGLGVNCASRVDGIGSTTSRRNNGSIFNAVRLAVLAELVEAHSPFDRLRANALNRTVLEAYELRGYDSFHLASALSLRDRTNLSFTFAVFDQRLRDGGRSRRACALALGASRTYSPTGSSRRVTS